MRDEEQQAAVSLEEVPQEAPEAAEAQADARAATEPPEACAVPEAAAEPGVTVGRIVLWWRYDRAHREVKAHPAIVTAVYGRDVVDLVAFATPMGSTDWRSGVPCGGPDRPGSWSWPPRVGP